MGVNRKIVWFAGLALASGTAIAEDTGIINAARRLLMDTARAALPISDSQAATPEEKSVDKALRQKESMEKAAPPTIVADPKAKKPKAVERNGAGSRTERQKDAPQRPGRNHSKRGDRR